MNTNHLFRRFWAYFFDYIIVGGMYMGILILLKMAGIQLPIEGMLERDYSVMSGFYITFGLLFLLYEVGFLCSTASATPGKLIVGLEVACFEHNHFFFRVLLRSVLKLIATLLQPLNFVFFLIAVFTERKQSLHDLVASTIVVRHEPAPAAAVSHFDIFEEMQKRGLSTYEEQEALIHELKGNPSCSSVSRSFTKIGYLLLLLSLVFYIGFITLTYEDIVQYSQRAALSRPLFREKGLVVEESIAKPYVGFWASEDQKAVLRIYYEEKTGMMYINTSNKGLEFRFDEDQTLFMLDGNGNEFRMKAAKDTLTLIRPVNKDLAMNITLRKVAQ